MPGEGVVLSKAKLFDAPEKAASFFRSSETFWSARNQRIQYWRQLVKQIDYKQRKRAKSNKYHGFEGNESSSFYAAMVQLLTKHPLKNRIPLAQDNAADRAVIGQVERLVEGTYRDVDFRRSRRMETDSLHTALTKFVCSDGWGAVETVQLKDSKDAVVDMRLYDVTDTAPEWSSDGLLAVVLRTYRTATQIALEYPSIDTSQFKERPSVGFASAPNEVRSIPVYSVYWREKQDNGKYKVFYGCAIDNQWAFEPYELSWTEDIPVVVAPLNGLPFRNNLTYSDTITPADDQAGDTPLERITDDWTADVGRGIFYMNESLYREFNDLWANVLDFIDKEGHDTFFKYTEGGDDSDIVIGRGADAVNPMKAGVDEKVERMPPGTLAQELNLALAQMGSALQRGGISWQLMGQLPGQEFSGFAINQLMSAALTIATPYLNGLSSIYRQLDQFLVQAYRTSHKSFVDVNVWREKTFVQERVDLSILKNRSFYFEPEIRPGLPNDLAQRIVMAGNAKQNRLLDQWTIADEILQMDDPDLIIARLDEEEIMARPTVKLRRMILQMLKEGNRESAIALLMELRLVESQLNLQQVGMDAQLQQFEQAAQPNAGASMNMESGLGGMGPGGGAPPPAPIRAMSGGGGVPPEVSPPELSGVSPAAMRAMLAAGNLL